MRRIGFALAIAAMAYLPAAMLSPALAQKKILTGGVDGAYNKTFCPPLPTVLADANFPNYKCTTSGGTLDNISQVLAEPTNIGFVQLDVFARESAAHPDYKDKLVLIRSDIACEGMWMVTKNTSITNFGDILGARRTPFVLPPEVSGSAASFKFVQSLDPDGLGRAKNIRFVAGAKEVIETVAASSDKSVGYFVQWADPENPNIKLMQERGLNVVPVVAREIMQAKIGNQDLYSVQSFNLTSGGWVANAKEATTSCTPVALVTGNPTAMKGRDAIDDQKDLVKAAREVPASKLLPQEDRLAKMMKGFKKLSGSALNDTLALVDKAKQAAIAASQ